MGVKSMASAGHVMGLKEMMVLILLWFCYLVQFRMVEGECKITSKGDISLDRRLEIAHKHSIKTVKNFYGDIFDCVDINKQPALHHPLLKDHTIKMRPSSFPESISKEVISTSATSRIRFLNEDCPTGTIPIMRPRENDNSTSNFDSRKTMNVHQHNAATNGSSYVAHLRMKRDKYYGTTADLIVYGLPQVSANQLSSSAIWIINDGDGFGPIDQVNSIMAGWMVNPKLFGDTNTRLFIYWTVDGFKNTGCYNLHCPGFVHISTEIPLGGIIHPLSVYNGPQYHIRILVFKDPRTGDWWLVFGKDQKIVGYWPKSLFCTLIDHANKIYWGGMVYSPINEGSPPMGSGHFPGEGWRKACAFENLKLVNGENTYTRISKDKIDYYQDDPNCYYMGPLSNLGRHGGQSFLYGGPGKCAWMI